MFKALLDLGACTGWNDHVCCATTVNTTIETGIFIVFNLLLSLLDQLLRVAFEEEWVRRSRE